MMQNDHKTGLVLEGGAMRGMFTAGVLDVFMEQGLEFGGAVGVSAGATFGCNIKSRQAGRSIRYNLRFAKDWRYCSLRSLITTGDLYGAEFCYDTIPFELDPFDAETYAANPMPFYVVATDMETGKPVYFDSRTGDREDLKWFRGSASMPLVSRTVEVDGRKLLDGGISDSIPLRFMQNRGFSNNVVVLTQPEGYVKKDSALGRWTARSLKDYPNARRALLNRPHHYNLELRYVKKCEEEGTALVIRPPEKLPVSRISHDPEKLKETYEIGRAEAERRLSEVRHYLEGGEDNAEGSCKDEG